MTVEELICILDKSPDKESVVYYKDEELTSVLITYLSPTEAMVELRS